MRSNQPWRTTAGLGLGVVAAYRLTADVLHVRRTLYAHNEAVAAAGERLAPSAIDQRYPDSLASAELVSREDFEGRLDDLSAELEIQREDPRLGICRDLDSAMYKVNRESAVFLGGGRAALLQIAHPYVAAGVGAHSAIARGAHGVQERFYQTFLYVFAMTFGDRSEAFRAARKVRSLHSKVHGRLGESVGGFGADSQYSAHHLDALVWVWATLLESSVLTYTMIVGPLSEGEKDEMVRSENRFCALFGLPKERIPQDWGAFLRYVGAMERSAVLKVSSEARRIEAFLFTPPSFLFAPLMRSLQRTARVLLPSGVRAASYDPLSPLSLLTRGVNVGRTRAVRRSIEKFSRLHQNLSRGSTARAATPPRGSRAPEYFSALASAASCTVFCRLLFGTCPRLWR